MEIDFKTFVLGCYKWQQTSAEEKLRFTFEIFDTRRCGSISLRDILRVIGTVHIAEGLGESAALERSLVVFSLFESDTEAPISLQHFVDVCKQNCYIMEAVE